MIADFESAVSDKDKESSTALAKLVDGIRKLADESDLVRPQSGSDARRLDESKWEAFCKSIAPKPAGLAGGFANEVSAGLLGLTADKSAHCI